MKKYLLLFFLFFLIPGNVFASENSNFVTVVNPVRGRHFWQSEESVKKQIDLTVKYGFPATWLLQYDLLDDDISLSLFRQLPKDQELGLFLESSEQLATDANVPYLVGEGSWARADKILLSGYTPAERKRLIDKVFDSFKKQFGYYPKAVGAWYIDTLSLNYLVSKYKVKAVLDVADQYQTDTYGLWGKPWSSPYSPSKFNSLIPAQKDADRLDVVKIQWAPRDPVRGYGLTVSDSIYSVQANDYSGQKLNIDYFEKLAQTYLFSANPVNQLTVGLEAGQEGAFYFEEYNRQLAYLDSLVKAGKIFSLTMSDFASEFKNKTTNSEFVISFDDYFNKDIQAFWYSNNYYRIGLMRKADKFFIRDLRVYTEPVIFDDIYKLDNSHSLKRIIPPLVDDAVGHNQKLLFTGIKKSQVRREDNATVISVIDNNGIYHEVSLTEKNVSVDKKTILELPDGNNFYRQTLSQILLSYWLYYPSDWIGGLRFSNINSKYYIGIMIGSDTLIGFKSEIPFLGIYKFPFQVLVRFKTLPQIGLDRLISENLVNRLNHSKIKIALNLNL